MVMKMLFSNGLALATLLAATGLPVAAQDLDAALEAQKKKASRRVYSESALLENRNLEVPRTETEEDRALEKKLREMEAKQDAAPPLQAVRPARVPVAVPQQTAEDRNWLTAAVLDELQSTNMPAESEDDWIVRELERRKERDTQATQARENELVEKLMREKTALPDKTSPLSPLQKYQPSTPALFGNKDTDAGSSRYTSIPNSLETGRRTSKTDPGVAPPLFSPAAARMNSALDKDPLRSTRPDPLYTTPGSTPRKSSSVFSYGQNAPEPVPLRPIEMIKQSSPINRPNPFADDYMPEFKSSIWQ